MQRVVLWRGTLIPRSAASVASLSAPGHIYSPTFQYGNNQPISRPKSLSSRLAGPVPRRSKAANRTVCQADPAAKSGGPLVVSAEQWDKLTQQAVSLATVAFVFLLMPQLVKNGINMYQGNSAALEVLSWVGFVTALFGNTLLLSYFLGKGETGAATVQTIGATSNVVMLTQMYMAGFMPSAAYAAVVVTAVAALAINGSKVAGLLGQSGSGSAVWGGWQDLLGLIGVAMLPQALWLTFTTSQSLAPAYVCGSAGIAFLAAEKANKLPPSLAGLWASVPAWTATLLFMFQPVAQLVRNFAVPASLTGLSVGSILLAMVGNGLMVPRALSTKDAIWFTGSAWGSLMGWAQLLSMFLGISASGSRYLSEPAFALATLVYFGFNAAVLQANSSSKGLSSPLASLATLASSSDSKALVD